MLEVRKLKSAAPSMGAPATCSTCGKPAFKDPEMKKITFATSKGSPTIVCLCKDCADHLQGALSLMI